MDFIWKNKELYKSFDSAVDILIKNPYLPKFHFIDPVFIFQNDEELEVFFAL